MKAAPALRRSTVREEPGLFEIRIPTKANIFIVVFMLAWLGGWTMGEVSVISELLSGRSGEGTGFMAFWLIGWTVGGGLAIYTVLWMIAGREVLRLMGDHLSIRREIFGVGRTREYDLSHVSNLRVASADPSPFWGPRTFPGMHPGIIAFDYGASTVRMGQSIDEAEALQITRELNARHRFHDRAA